MNENSPPIIKNSWSCLYKELISYEPWEVYVKRKHKGYSRKGLKLSTDELDMRGVPSVVVR